MIILSSQINAMNMTDWKKLTKREQREKVMNILIAAAKAKGITVEEAWGMMKAHLDETMDQKSQSDKTHQG